MSLLAILEHWLAVNLILGGFWCCYRLIQMADADREAECRARCKESAEWLMARIEAANARQAIVDAGYASKSFPASFRVGSLANPIPTPFGDRAYFTSVEELTGRVIE